VVKPAASSFSIALNETQVSVPKGGSAAVGVTVVRKGYTGPMVVKVLNPPAGLTVRPGQIGEGQLVGTFTVSAAADAAFDVQTLDVVADASGGGGPALVKAEKVVVFAEQGGLPTNAVTQVGLAAVPAVGQGVSLDAPGEPIEVAHGFGIPVPLKVVRDEKGGEGSLAFTLPAPPPGLTLAGGKLGEKDTEVTVTLNTTTERPLGLVTVALTGKGKIGGTEKTIETPAVTLNVVKPAAVELATKALEIKAGTSIEVKGKVVRKGGFKEAVTVKLNGLPAGLKAEPVNVAADATEFTAKIAAEEKAAAATAEVSVALACQVNKKDYPAPTAPLTVKVLPAK
jgi:hypothetical protein